MRLSRRWSAQPCSPRSRVCSADRGFERELIPALAELFLGTGRRIADVVADPASAAAETRDADDDYLVALAREHGVDQIEQLVQLRDQLDACIGCRCLSLDRCAICNPEVSYVAGGEYPSESVENKANRTGNSVTSAEG